MSALDDLQAVMFQWKDQMSVIKPKLHLLKSGWWRLQYVEEMFDDSYYQTYRFDNCIRWTDEKLKDWPDCKRMSWDMWDFKHRSDAEKFITLFHLSWEQ